jgi:hypothetical protein
MQELMYDEGDIAKSPGLRETINAVGATEELLWLDLT